MKSTFKPARLTFQGIRFEIDANRTVRQVGAPDATVGAELAQQVIAEAKRLRRNRDRRERDQVCRDMGLTKVRGNLGGTYWE